MKTIDDVIEQCEEIANASKQHTLHMTHFSQSYDEWAEEWIQLAEWLKELKAYKEQQPCEDVISREDALKALCQAVHKNDDNTPCPNQRVSCLWNKTKVQDYAEEILKLPSATPQRKTGRWKRMSDLPNDVDDRFECSRCGNVVHHRNVMDLRTFNRWCGRCGSDNG